jgi:hypothetical protein
MLTPSQLLSLGKAYARAEGIALSSVGQLAAGNDKSFLRLAAGGTIHLRTAVRAEAWLRANWPNTAIWPDDVPGGPTHLVPAGSRPVIMPAFVRNRNKRLLTAI